MTSALPSPGPADLLTRWSLQPVALLLAAALLVWYVRATLLARPACMRRRTAWLVTGTALFVWTTCGFPQVYAPSLYWVWTAQALVLLLVVPLLLLAGRPLDVARSPRASRVLASGPVRVLGNPLVGPALIPALSFALFFGPVAGLAIHVPPFGWLLQVVLVSLGALVLLPLVGTDDTPSSLAVGLSLAIGSVELVLDAVPGIVLRLKNVPATTFFDHRVAQSWAPAALHDQQIAGAVLWCVAELIDLPFLLLVFRRWLRADARDAAAVDAVLEAERVVRPVAVGEPSDTGPADAPWWLTDRAMQRRLSRPD